MLPVVGLTDQVTLAPEGRFRTENCCVPEGATLAVAGLTLVGGEACRVKLAVPRTASVEEFVAVTVIVVWAATLLGAVYKPLGEMLPVTGPTDQVTLAPEGRFWTENCCVPEGATVAVEGLTLGGGGDACRVRLAVPRTASAEEFVAVTVRVVWTATLLGAVYKPLDVILPVGGLTDQVTPTPEGRFGTENCCVPEGATVAVAGLTLVGGEAWRVKLAVPRTESVEEEFVAVTVIVVWAATLLGAVYKPLDVIFPFHGLTDQVTLAPEGRFWTENCWVPVGATVAVAGLTRLRTAAGER
jgi:hypothetical protein